MTPPCAYFVICGLNAHLPIGHSWSQLVAAGRSWSLLVAAGRCWSLLVAIQVLRVLSTAFYIFWPVKSTDEDKLFKAAKTCRLRGRTEKALVKCT